YRAHLPGTLFYLDERNPVVPLLSASRVTADRGPNSAYVTTSGESIDLQRLFGERPDSLLITDPQGLNELRPQLPADAMVLDERPRFPKRGELVVVGRRPTADASQRAANVMPAAAAPPIQSIQR